MRNLVLIFVFGTYSMVSSQYDTLSFESQSEFAGYISQNLNSVNYQGRLVERVLDPSYLTLRQMEGNYSDTFEYDSYLLGYSDLFYSFEDSLKIPSGLDHHQYADSIIKKINFENEYLDIPLGIFYYKNYKFNVNSLSQGYMNFINDQIFEDPIHGSMAYEDFLHKGASPMIFPINHKFDKAYLTYNENTIFIDEEFDVKGILVSVDNSSFTSFTNGTKIQIPLNLDEVLVKTIILFENGGNDTIISVLKNNQPSPLAKGATPSLDRKDWQGQNINIRYGIAYGCGHNGIKKPIIFIPGYRPDIQWVNLSTYYDKYNHNGLLNELRNRGYDIIIIRPESGSVSVKLAGDDIAEFIKFINNKKYSDNSSKYETIVVGYSYGGQVAKYALLKMEYEHMIYGEDHHHTRLYFSYDSPHHGASYPFADLIGCKDMEDTGNILAMIAMGELRTDGARELFIYDRDESYNTYLGQSGGWKSYKVDPTVHPKRTDLVNTMLNDFNHIYSNVNDQRRGFPAFTRNVSLSLGSYLNNYSMDLDFQLYPGDMLFRQNAYFPLIVYNHYKYKETYASKNEVGHINFRRNDQRYIFLVIPVSVRKRIFITDQILATDHIQGGYQNSFHDATNTAFRLGALFMGQNIYDGPLCHEFIPSTMAINPSTWTADLYWNPRSNGLMFQHWDIQGNSPSEFYGYPNLSNPSDHFDITPFEAVYCDLETYQHIKPNSTVRQGNEHFLDSMRVYMLSEIEPEILGLQNKVIGENHKLNAPLNFYKAEYQAQNRINIGYEVTPKTDKGDFIIEETGEVVVHAGNEVVMKNGFHTQSGSKYHAYIGYDYCNSGLIENQNDYSGNTNFNLFKNEISENSFPNNASEKIKPSILIVPNPNSGEFSVVLNRVDQEPVNVVIYDLMGKEKFRRSLIFDDKINLKLNLAKGVYVIKVVKGIETYSDKIVIQ